MAKENVTIARGLKANVPTTMTPGRINVATDTGEMFVDDTTSSRVQIKDSTKISFTESQTLTDTQKDKARTNIDADSKVVVTFDFSVSPAVITDPEGYDGAKILADIQSGKSVYAKVGKRPSSSGVSAGAVLPYYSGAESTNTTSGGFLFFRSAAPSFSAGGEYQSLYFPCIRVYVQGTGDINPYPYSLEDNLVDVAKYGYTRNKFNTIENTYATKEALADVYTNVSVSNWTPDETFTTTITGSDLGTISSSTANCCLTLFTELGDRCITLYRGDSDPSTSKFIFISAVDAAGVYYVAEVNGGTGQTTVTKNTVATKEDITNAKDTFVVNVTMVGVADKTYAETKAAIEAHKVVIAWWHNALQFGPAEYTVHSVTDDKITFCHINYETLEDPNYSTGNPIIQFTQPKIFLKSDNTVEVEAFDATRVLTENGATAAFVGKSSTNSVAYVTDANGNQSTLGYSASSDNTAGQLAVRAADGGVNVPLIPGSTSRATSKYYVDNNFVSYNTFTENNMGWGGPTKTNATPIDAAIIPSIGGNKFELCRAAGITVEYSNDSGSTWTDYGLTDIQKIAQLSIKNNSDKIYIGKKTNSKAGITDQVRVTVNAQQCGVYTLVKKILINISTNGASGCKVTVEGSKDASTWTSLKSDATIAGWSGWNSLPITAYFSFGSVGNYQYARLTFSITGVSSNYNSNLDIRNIIFVGVENWTTPSNISETGHLYSYDYEGNATFPSNVTATKFIGDGSGLTNLPVSEWIEF